MKKVIIASLLLFPFTAANACEICGCGIGGYYIGILPEFNKHVLGIRYRYNSLRSHLGAGGVTTYMTATERYQTAELWGAISLGKKFRIMASFPYAIDERINQGVTSSKSGIGDITLTGYYHLLNKSAMAGKKKLYNSLWMGAGIKFPTGKYTAADKQNTSQNTNLFQLGTGSWDFSANFIYDLRINKAGLNISAGYKMNSANRYAYNYGNKLNAAAQLYYKFKPVKKFSIAPNAGVLIESSKKDIDNKITVDMSGGRLLLGSIGMEAAFGKILTGASWQTPLSQNLANGFVKANNRFMLHVSFSF